MCNCKVTEIVLGIVILVFAFWELSFSKWVIVIAALLLLLHGLFCKDNGICGTGMKAKPATSRRKK